MELLESLFHHLVLPPKVPTSGSAENVILENKITNRFLAAAQSISQGLGDADDLSAIWSSIRVTLDQCLKLNEGRLNKVTLLQEFERLQTGETLIMHVTEQNAALLCYRKVNDEGEDSIIFESFEASPPSMAVLETIGALHWDFPGRCAKISASEFYKPSFQDSMTTFLEQASTENVSRFAARASKAGASVVEERDTADPALITQMLLPLIEGLGEYIDVPKVRKHVRDDVNFDKAQLAWRRLPFYLVLRVALQRHLYLNFGEDTGRACYKFLVCTVLRDLLQDCAGSLAPEQSMMLKTKLGRRLAKLEQDRARLERDKGAYDRLFCLLGDSYKASMEAATAQVSVAWNHFKQQTLRKIHKLPKKAAADDMTLSLPNSGHYLNNLLKTSLTNNRFRFEVLGPPVIEDASTKHVLQFTRKHFQIATLKMQLREDNLDVLQDDFHAAQSRCQQLAACITNLMIQVGTLYEASKEYTSLHLLDLFELWVKMDRSAVQACPLIAEYAPIFRPALLDVLQLPLLVHMVRLQKIQFYLRERWQKSRFPGFNIFTNADKSGQAFSVRYVASDVESQQLMQTIEEASARAKATKEAELDELTTQYEELTAQILDGICRCTMLPDGSKDVHGCQRCYYIRVQRRLRIGVFERFLPKAQHLKSAVLFELNIPMFLEDYRNATWELVKLALPDGHKGPAKSPAIVLTEYSQLAPYLDNTPRGISMASLKKSFLQTHYDKLRMVVEAEDVLHPFGPEFSLYDLHSRSWVDSSPTRLTLKHLCSVEVPSMLQSSVSSASEDKLSSSEIIANQTRCPANTSIHEFSALQKLLSVKSQRWLNILVEIGSSNLNFSTEATTRLIGELAVQAGPSVKIGGVLRDAHWVFTDEGFCERLLKQIEGRLAVIKTNWRESYCMELILTLLLRMYTLTRGNQRHATEHLLKSARKALSEWIVLLRAEMKQCETSDAVARTAHYGLWAALLCRRTFAPFIENRSISAADLSTYVHASISLQQNLVMEIEKLPWPLRGPYVRDIQMAFQLRDLVKQSIQAHPDAMSAAFQNAFGDDLNRSFTEWRCFDAPHDHWVGCIATVLGLGMPLRETIQFNFVEGHLFLNGSPLAKLPVEIQGAPETQELFGDQYLLAAPSNLDGMSHQLARSIHGYRVHFGHRNGRVFIRALRSEGMLEFIPRSTFTSRSNIDLPSSLIDESVHWLNLQRRTLHIRRRQTAWVPNERFDWIIDLATGKCTRPQESLVSPQSQPFSYIAEAFRGFVDKSHLTVYQKINNNLRVDIKGFELSFVVNSRGVLQCRELNAQMDSNQDAGTFYGLKSMIVLQDIMNLERRSIIVALGDPRCYREGMHVAVWTDEAKAYARLEIDNVLGRVVCAAEPVIQLFKALAHAHTSFVIPDPLTGRTGAEEAFFSLRSASPWTPLNEKPLHTLSTLRKLGPLRLYYPPDKRRLQTVKWDPHLTMSIQQDFYGRLTRGLEIKSNNLSALTLADNKTLGSVETHGVPHLCERGEKQRQLYEAVTFTEDSKITIHQGAVYQARDREVDHSGANVYLLGKYFRDKPASIYQTRPVLDIFKEMELVDGFGSSKGDGCALSLGEVIKYDVRQNFGSLTSFCRATNVEDPYHTIFRLALLSFGGHQDQDVVRLLAALSLVEDLRIIKPPLISTHVEPRLDDAPSLASLITAITTTIEEMPELSARQIAQGHNPYPRGSGRDALLLAQLLRKQWPSPSLVIPSVEDFDSSTVNVIEAVSAVLPLWQSHHNKLLFERYLARLQGILNKRPGQVETSTTETWKSIDIMMPRDAGASVVPSLSRDLLSNFNADALSEIDLSVPPEPSHFPTTSTQRRQRLDETQQQRKSEHQELLHILRTFCSTKDGLRKHYGNDLQRSLTALATAQSFIVNVPTLGSICAEDMEIFEKGFVGAAELSRNSLLQLNGVFRTCMVNREPEDQWLRLTNLWPRVTPVTLLELLRSVSGTKLRDETKKLLTFYGILITQLQRYRRLCHFLRRRDERKFLEELANPGHTNWDPYEFPDWLLLEIESNIVIRSGQIEVARAIISPASGANSVLQLNMGQGKTSCIVPAAMALLANKKQLARLIVPKALLRQSAQILQARLGGLLGRETRHLPFSRRTKTNTELLKIYANHHKDMLRQGGVILTIPEHLLSFRLSGLQRLTDGKLEEARNMIKIQDRLDEICRDVIDESDIILSVKTHLIYPSGQLVHVDGAPYRWRVVMMLLDLIAEYLPGIQRRFRYNIEPSTPRIGYPIVRFVQSQVEDYAQLLMVNTICDGQAPLLAFKESISPDQRDCMKRVMSDKTLQAKDLARLVPLFIDPSSAAKKLLLIRGLLVNRILMLCLKKRWNVQYGLHPKRDPVAVPFEAKGIPSELAEFGHPDVAIILTCLAFYYTGLNHDQFCDGLKKVLKSDDPASEYDRWTQGIELDDSLRHWNVINPEDKGQVGKLWQQLHFSRSTIDHYLNEFVFPAHAKAFTIKLESSAWDIPQYSDKEPTSQNSVALTTGFSGTNDNRLLLPLNIKQDDLDNQRHTNAQVLAYLLEPRNRTYQMTATRGKRFTEYQLLDDLCHKKIKILIDAGAYILELSNEQLAEVWVSKSDAPAAVFFGPDNRAYVRYKGVDKAVLLVSTPFADDLANCLIYLDEAHTRGVDLQLPEHAKGALTLALGQTKDHTVQAAMRLRQLGSQQSVVFFAPPEVDQSIKNHCNLRRDASIDSSHVVSWLLEQTCLANEQLRNLYQAQGFDYARRQMAQHTYSRFLTDETHRDRLTKVIRAPERQTLEELYGGKATASTKVAYKLESTRTIRRFTKELAEQRTSSNDGAFTVHNSVLEEVEQEREVEHQVEEVREIEKPEHYRALPFSKLHPVIENFVTTGKLDAVSGIMHAFEVTANTSIGQRYGVKYRESALYVSFEYTRTVQLKPGEIDDNVTRPVEWLLWSRLSDTAIILVPEEVDIVIPILRRQKSPNVHILTYAAPYTKAMTHFNNLKYYAFPTLATGYALPHWLVVELGIFAGRLYFSFEEYQVLATYLEKWQDSGSESTFCSGPLGNFLLEWFGLRRKGQDILHTPMGHVCQGRKLEEDHIFFTAGMGNGKGKEKNGVEIADGEAADTDGDDIS